MSLEHAIGTICHDRQKDIWAFHKAVTKHVDVIPFFEALKEGLARDGSVVLIGKDAKNRN